jgi:DNA-binding GntR family transcriptional regulator
MVVNDELRNLLDFSEWHASLTLPMEASINSDLAYDFIRKRILNGEFRPGQHLNAKVLAKQISVSVTPVRDALRQLETDRLVTINPRQGAKVNAMNLKQFSELCELRMILEIHAAGLAAQRRSEVELHEIGVALEEMQEATTALIAGAGDDQERHLAALVRADTQFHVAILSAAKNELVRDEILRLQLINRVMAGAAEVTGSRILTTALEPDHLRAVQANHASVYRAIERRDVDAARAAMEEGLRDIIEQMVRAMTRRERDFLTREFTERT